MLRAWEWLQPPQVDLNSTRLRARTVRALGGSAARHLPNEANRHDDMAYRVKDYPQVNKPKGLSGGVPSCSSHLYSVIVHGSGEPGRDSSQDCDALVPVFRVLGGCFDVTGLFTVPRSIFLCSLLGFTNFYGPRYAWPETYARVRRS